MLASDYKGDTMRAEEGSLHNFSSLLLARAGAGNMQTLLILGSEKAVSQFLGAKSGPVVLGQDLSLGKKLGFDVIDDTNIFNHREVITHSIQDGHLVDWSLIGMIGSLLVTCLLCFIQKLERWFQACHNAQDREGYLLKTNKHAPYVYRDA